MEQDESAIGQEADDTLEELLEQARINAQALIMATIAFLDEHGFAIDDWTAAIGRTFAKAWDAPLSWDADEFMEAMLINYRSLGATVVTSTLAPDLAEAILVDFPDPDLCAMFGVEPSSVARFNDAAGGIARQCGLSWVWQLTDGRTRCVVSRRTSG